jgi:hypothetical protein
MLPMDWMWKNSCTRLGRIGSNSTDLGTRRNLINGIKNIRALERKYNENSNIIEKLEIDLFKSIMAVRSSTRQCEVLNTMESTE